MIVFYVKIYFFLKAFSIQEELFYKNLNMRVIVLIISFILFGQIIFAQHVLDNDTHENEGSVVAEINDDPLSPDFSYIENLKTDSIALLIDLLKVEPQNEQLLTRLGKLYTQHKQMEDAFLIYSQLIIINPEHHDACLFLGHYYYIQGKKLLQQEDSNFKKITNPRTMEYASYQNNVKEILDREYTTAAKYLTTFLSLKKSKLVENVLQIILNRIDYPDAIKR